MLYSRFSHEKLCMSVADYQDTSCLWGVSGAPHLCLLMLSLCMHSYHMLLMQILQMLGYQLDLLDLLVHCVSHCPGTKTHAPGNGSHAKSTRHPETNDLSSSG